MGGQAHTSYTMSALCGAGAITAFARKRSLPSLGGGLLFAGLYLAAGEMIRGLDRAAEGHTLAAASSLALAGLMGSRYLKTRKVFPALVLTVAATATAAISVRFARIEWGLR